MVSLTVYQASAGSGKTFTLAAEYIARLVKHPGSYRQILAVTFTNKATEEMKTRILSQLYAISHGHSNSEPYVDFVCRKLGCSREMVRERASTALTTLLHNYSYFRVETIDSFFQSVLRNLARELDLTANLRIGLNDVQVEEMAVDQMIEGLQANAPMMKWLLGYIMDNISEDRSWNVMGQIKQFGRTIFRDFYKQESRQMAKVTSQPGFFDRYNKELQALRRQAMTTMRKIADEFFSTLEGEGLTIDDLSYGKSGVAGLFLKLKNGEFDESVIGKRATDCAGQPEKWCKKTHLRRELIVQLAGGRLGELLQQAIDEQPRQWKNYQSASLTLRHLTQLRLLEGIEKKVRQLNEEQNRFLLSDTQQLLHELISGDDSPFIFEKIGTQLEHIMIDEFQDTSTVQWRNFKILLQETMSHQDSENLIVGDVKQSIYRWRSGDWRLLAHITDEMGNYSKQLQQVPLKYNYRSCRRIVTFNNAFFSEAARAEQVSAYDGVEQLVPDNRKDEGLVSIRLLPAGDYEEQTLRMLVSQVEELLDAGASPGDIAILVRTNAHIPLIANRFLEQLPQLRVVSDEAFRLDASTAVQTIVRGMQFLADPANTIAQAFLARIYTSEALHERSIAEMLPAALSEEREQLLRMPLYDLAERLSALFGLERMTGEHAYLYAFYDQVAGFVEAQGGGLTDFLREWDATIGSKTIQSAEIDGVRLLSIHKSKGLEFAHVLVPFCDWRLEQNDILWCHPAEAPFNELPLVPVDYSQKGMRGTVYQGAYDEEHQQNVVDNLNLLYVAFTRASRNLFVYGRLGGANTRSALIGQLLPVVAEQLDGAEFEMTADEMVVFRYGTLSLPVSDRKDAVAEHNVFLATPRPIDTPMEILTPKVTFRQSNKSRQFAVAGTDEPSAEDQQRESYIQLGQVLHQLFSAIRTVDDIEPALQQMEFDGILYDRRITRQRLHDLISRRLSHPRVAEWFAPHWTLFNECTILSIDPASGQVRERRPDRVMTDGERTIVVDFKFGQPRDEYLYQVREYMQLLTDMGHTRVEGFLWYVYSNQIQEVKL